MKRPSNRLLAGAAFVLTAAALAAGCGGSDEAGSSTTETETTTTTPSSDLKVALVADAGQLNDNGFNELAYKGLKRAQRVLGVEQLPDPTGYWGAVLALTLSTYPYVFLLAQAALRDLDPSLEEAARSLGLSRRRAFAHELREVIRRVEGVQALVRARQAGVQI